MSDRRVRVLLSILSVVLLMLSACAINPVTGKRELMLISEEQEIQYGVEGDKEICAEYGVVANPALSAYVERLGQNMSRITHRPTLQYHFRVLDTPVVNAFAVPGGYIYVTRGILAYLNDEAELAGVIGHELGHVNARHTARSISQQQLAMIGLQLGYAFSEKLRNLSGLAEFGVNMLFLKFSRDDERQADNLGVEYASKVDYDTYRMAAFFETLERMSASEGGSGLPDWFSTHPNPENRVLAVRKKTAQWQAKLAQPQYVVNRDSYLRTISGITFGEDPTQGYVSDNAFYQPTLRFSFPVPRGWTVNNMSSQVQVASPTGNATIILMLDSAATAAASADQFISKNGAVVQARQALTVNGFASQKVVSRVTSESDTMKLMSYFILKGGTVYQMHGLTTPALYPQYADTFASALGGFRQLTDASRINVKPQRLAVRSIGKAAPLRTILKQGGIADDRLDEMAIMNGMQLDETVPAGTLIKIPAK
jgi:predicted Zn-dependent protease